METPRPLRTLGALALAALPSLPAVALAGAAISLPLALSAPAALAQEPEEDDNSIGELLEEAMEQLQRKDYEGALQTYATVIRRVERADAPEEQRAQVLQLAHYNSACALSLQGKKEAALDRFEKALEHGFLDFDHIAKDTDLDAIRDDDRFKALVKKHRERDTAERSSRSERERAEFLKNISKDALFPFDYEGRDVFGKALRLKDRRGKVVLVDVWGTWCPPCRAEVPHLIELHEKLGPKGFSILGLACERVPAEEAPTVVRKFLEENKVPYPSAVIDGKFPSKAIPGFEGFPTMLLVDRAGRVRMKVVGYTEGALLEAAIERLLAEEAPADSGPAPTPATPETPPAEGGRREF
jgi:thiol-disulfide isomerase/thioredoxin